MDTESARIEHLRMIQAVIGRMAGNSFAIKNVSAVLTGGLVAVTVTAREPMLALGGLAVLVLWGLDGYYLSLERRFVDEYNQIRRGSLRLPGSPGYFQINGPTSRGGRTGLSKAMFSAAVFTVHLSLAGALGATALIVHFTA
jgi:hypothetical protein